MPAKYTGTVAVGESIKRIQKSFEDQARDEVVDFERTIKVVTNAYMKYGMRPAKYGATAKQERECYLGNIQVLRDQARSKLAALLASEAVKYSEQAGPPDVEWRFMNKVSAITAAIKWVDGQ